MSVCSVAENSAAGDLNATRLERFQRLVNKSYALRHEDKMSDDAVYLLLEEPVALIALPRSPR